MKASELVIGVDGGGTKTVAWLASLDESSELAILGRGKAGPSNMRAVGETVATSNLGDAIADAFVDAGIEQNTIGSACLGLAGADRQEESTVFGKWAEQIRLADRVHIVNDALPVLHAGTPDGCGIAVIAGTGSFAFGRDSSGSTARCGGWGYLFGDEGSGYAIARAGLRAAARFADGRGPQTCLLDLFLKHFDLRDASELITTIYAEGVDRRTIAALAQLVSQASRQHDSPATEIIHQAAKELAELVTTIARTLHLSNSIPLVLTGGVLLNDTAVSEYVENQLQQSDRHSYTVTTVSDPVIGALRIALHRRD